MPTQLTCFRIFIASPDGLSDERRAFREEIQDYNESEAIHRGVMFQPFGWEDTLGAVGRPQSIINEDIRRADFFVLVLWNRWGSAPDVKSSRFSSGTDEEYHVALECYEASDQPMRQLVLLFKAIDPQQLSDPGPQLESVLKFKKELEVAKTHLFHTFDSETRFRQLLRAHLGAWVRGREKDSAHGGTFRPEPQISSDRVSTEYRDINERATTSEPVDASLTARAWALADEGRLTEAEVEFARAIVGRLRSEALVSYGEFLYRVGRLDQATVLFEKAIEIAQDQPDQEIVLASATSSLGRVRQIRGDLEGAEQMYRNALEINEKLSQLEGMADANISLGNVLRFRGDFDHAEQVYRKALEINETLGISVGLASAHLKLGTLQLIRGELEGAERFFRNSLEIAQKINDREGMAKAYGSLGLVFRTRGDLDLAREMHRKSIEIDEKLGRLEGVSSSYVNLGIVFQQQGDIRTAEQMFRKSLEIDETLGNLEGMAICYTNLGSVLQARGDLDGAEQMHRKSLEIKEKLGQFEGIAISYGNLGVILKQKGNVNAAEQMYRKSIEINEKLGSLAGLAAAYGNLGLVLRSQKDLPGAEQMYRKSLAAAERLGSPPSVEWAKALLSSLQETPAAKEE